MALEPSVQPVQVRARFAPSPTGFLHIGSAWTALFNWLLARHGGGELMLRIEDTDADRSTDSFVDLIFESLTWLGLDWDGDPVFQSRRRDCHLDAVRRLLDMGHAYWCGCTRDEIDARAKERGGKPGYDGHCRDRGLKQGSGAVVRFRTPDAGVTVVHDSIRGDVAFPNEALEDFVILRSNGVPMFLVANAVDDIDMGITHVLRGQDLLNTTPKGLLLREALGARSDDLAFGHLPLIVNAQGKKYSKRDGAVAIEEFRDEGYLPEAMVNYLATLGWGAPDGVELRPISEIVELFELTTISRSPAMFDVKKLANFNGDYIRALPLAEFVARSQPFLLGELPPPVSAAPPGGPLPLRAYDPLSYDPLSYDPGMFEPMAPLVQERVKTLAEVARMVDFLFVPDSAVLEPEAPDGADSGEAAMGGSPEHVAATGGGTPRGILDDKSWQKVMVKGRDLALVVLDFAIDHLAILEPWSSAAINDLVIGYADANDIPRAKAQAPVRVAVTGRSVGPPLWEAIEVLGRDRTLGRLRAARSKLG